MSNPAPKPVPMQDLGPAFERMARLALTEGLALVSVPGADDLVIVPRQHYERRRSQLRRFVMENGVSDEAAALMDDAIELGRKENVTRFGS